MIFASSSGDHLDCFFAGDWRGWSWLEESRLAGTADRGWGGRGATLVATLDGTEPDRDTEAGELVDRPSSSSFGLSSDEISTMRVGTGYRLESRGGGVVFGRQWVLPYNSGRDTEEVEGLWIRLRKRAQVSTGGCTNTRRILACKDGAGCFFGETRTRRRRFQTIASKPMRSEKRTRG